MDEQELTALIMPKFKKGDRVRSLIDDQEWEEIQCVDAPLFKKGDLGTIEDDDGSDSVWVDWDVSYQSDGDNNWCIYISELEHAVE